MPDDLEFRFESAWLDTRVAVVGPDIVVDIAVDIPVDIVASVDIALA